MEALISFLDIYQIGSPSEIRSVCKLTHICYQAWRAGNFILGGFLGEQQKGKFHKDIENVIIGCIPVNRFIKELFLIMSLNTIILVQTEASKIIFPVSTFTKTMTLSNKL